MRIAIVGGRWLTERLAAAAAAINACQESLTEIQRGQGRTTKALTELLRRSDTMATQADVDRIVTAIDTATTGIRQDITELKAAADAGQALDFSALDAKVAALAALDAENPAAAPAEPAPVDVPVDDPGF